MNKKTVITEIESEVLNPRSTLELSELNAVNASVTKTDEVIAINAGLEGFAVTAPKFIAPLIIDANLKTDSNNIRLKFAKGMIILNWEVQADELRWQHPVSGEWDSGMGTGKVPAEEWMMIRWIIMEDRMMLSVNGEERLHVHGEFGGAAGQVGIGTAFGATVTLQSLRITGETTTSGDDIVPPPRFRWDGGFIYVHYDDHDDAVQWYTRHLGLQLTQPTWEGRHDPMSKAEKMSSLAFPAGGLIHIKSVSSEVPLKHFIAETDSTVRNVGFTFNCANLAAARQTFLASGLHASEIAIGPDGNKWFELVGFNGIPHIIRTDDRHDWSCEPVSRYGPWYVTVADMAAAVEWYKEVLELHVLRTLSPERCVEMEGHLYLICEPSTISDRQLAGVGASCPYFFTRDIELEHNRFISLQVEASEVVGTGWKAMHIHDLFGNRLNFWSY
jgi:catechol 2,3-dioxygenase-like lactoylglutathione lyase family enzyme